MSGLYVLALLAIWVWLTKWLFKGSQWLLTSRFANQTVRVALVVAVALLWLGGTFWEVAGKKMYWDAKVRKLCAIDGGVKVYETVELSAEKFNKWGQPNFYRPDQKENALGPEYLVKYETLFLRAETENPTLVKHHLRVFRRSDNKLLGERIAYGRGGGDFPGPWYPSSFNCPDPQKGGLLDVLFTKSNSKE
jgi:hypothetical protein